ncbi:protein kinase [Streptosporangium sp. NPDC000396]|uniref:protein kinase domain-containing protein n=1 Tax=Streptosporangium sp. NPDC000396 TaxID=3366185 RepID=UPI0036C28559
MRSRRVGRRYELVEEISAGAMGQVWRGYDAVLDREVAIKLILPGIVSSAEDAEVLAKRFRREARITARINHHGVPQVYDAVLDEDFTRLYLVMELVHGTLLSAFVSPGNPLPISWAVAVIAQVCTVLSHAHAIPVVHRDLKPDNLMVAEDGTVKVLDFGIAAILQTGVTRLTAAGALMGTTRYMSPEQIQAVQVTPQSDLYAVGCIMHELLTSRPVFADGPRLVQQHLFEEPPPLRGIRSDVPAELERLTLELLEKLPERRPVDAQMVFERLLPFLPDRGSSPSASERSSVGIPDPTRPYRNPCAPRRRPEQAVTELAEDEVVSADDALKVIKAALEQSDELLGEERFAQAADVLRAVLKSSADALGADNRRVLSLRQRRAAILVIGGDFRRALPEFDRLAEAYARIAGPGDIETLECRRQAALCRAELGQGAAALEQLRQVLVRYRAAKSDGDEAVLELRRDIGSLLATEGHAEDAIAVLQPLEQDLDLLYGPAHPLALEVRDLLARLRLTSG